MDKRLPRYTGKIHPDPDRHDGRLKYALGASNYQITRADRFRPELCDGVGWTYNHAADLTYWNGRFYMQYLSVPAYEHVAPSVSLLTSSADGIHWDKPVVSFPVYELPAARLIDAEGHEHIIPEKTYAVMHQRMAFYNAHGRLLVLGFYGNSDTPEHNPFTVNGVGRVVRELYPDGSLSPIYFIRYNTCAGWTEDMLKYPMYTKSGDKGFVRACEELLEDKLATQQWIDEHGYYDPLIFKQDPELLLEAFNWYSIDEKTKIGLWKWSMVTRSDDGGETWAEAAFEPSLLMPGSKVWGERTSDGRFALVTTPTTIQNCRWPLAVMTSDDGFDFTDMLCIHGEVPQPRYLGWWKSYGPQYMRGLTEGQGRPADGAMYIVYSVNKEDMWITRVPVPIRGAAEGYVDEDFQGFAPDTYVDGWNIYSPLRCPVRVKKYGDRNYLELRDSDRSDYAKAVKIFKESERLTLETSVQINRADAHGELWLELTDGGDNTAACVRFCADRAIRAVTGGEPVSAGGYEIGKWVDVKILLDCPNWRYDVEIDGKPAGRFRFTYPVTSAERLVFRTGGRRFLPNVYSNPDSAEYVRDVAPEEDAERLEIIALVQRVRVSPI